MDAEVWIDSMAQNSGYATGSCDHRISQPENLLRNGANAGGDAAHVGGAIAGFFFIRNSHLLRDFFDVFGDSRRANPARPPGVLYPGIEMRRRCHQLNGAIAGCGELLDGGFGRAVPGEAECVSAKNRKRHAVIR